MYSAWARLNAVVFFAISLLGIAAFLSALTTYFHVSKPVVSKFEFNQLRELKPIRNKKKHSRDIDRADLTFDLECDLSSVFNWCVITLCSHASIMPLRCLAMTFKRDDFAGMSSSCS